MKVWEARTGKELLTIKGHSNVVMDSAQTVVWSPDGRCLASISNDQTGQTAKVWEARTGAELLTLKGHTDNVVCVAWSPDGQRLASGSDDTTVKVWEARPGQELVRVEGYTNPDFNARRHFLGCQGLAWSPDGQRLARGAWSPDGQCLASASAWPGTPGDNRVTVWAARTGQHRFTLKGHTETVNSVAWSPDGQRLASCSEDKTLKVWVARTGQVLLTLKGHTNPVTSVAWSPDGKRIVSASGDPNADPLGEHSGGEVKVWEARTGQELLNLKHTHWVSSVAWSPDGQRLARASADKTVKVWEARTGQELLILKGHTKGVQSVTWSSDGQRLASGSDDGTVKIWEARTGQELLTLKGDTNGVDSVTWSSDGQRLASNDGGQSVKVWEARASLELLILKGHAKKVARVEWSPDGKRVVATDHFITKSWLPDTGKEIAPCEDLHSNLTRALSPDGQHQAFVNLTKTLSPDGQHQAFVQDGRLYVGPRRLRVDDLALQQEENPVLTYLWHLSMASEASQQGDDHALFFHLRPLILSFFTQLDARSRAFDSTWAQPPPLGFSAAHLQRLREELDREVAVPPAGWEAWAARAWCRHDVQGDAAGAAADLDQRPAAPAPGARPVVAPDLPAVASAQTGRSRALAHEAGRVPRCGHRCVGRLAGQLLRG